MTRADLAINAVLSSIDNGLKIEAAARVLTAEAQRDDQHPKLANMLRVNAEALATHPNPAHLLRGNESRLNAMIASSDPSTWGDVRAEHITMAAMAFERAAHAMEA